MDSTIRYNAFTFLFWNAIPEEITYLLPLGNEGREGSVEFTIVTSLNDNVVECNSKDYLHKTISIRDVMKFSDRDKKNTQVSSKIQLSQ
jgi:hypothetical protein